MHDKSWSETQTLLKTMTSPLNVLYPPHADHFCKPLKRGFVKITLTQGQGGAPTYSHVLAPLTVDVTTCE